MDNKLAMEINVTVNWHPGVTLAEMKALTIALALEHFGGNKTRAAQSLGISVRTMRYYVAKIPQLAKYRIDHRGSTP